VQFPKYFFIVDARYRLVALPVLAQQGVERQTAVFTGQSFGFAFEGAIVGLAVEMLGEAERIP